MENKEDMSNAAYTQEYLEYRKEYEAKFFIEAEKKDSSKININNEYYYIETDYSVYGKNSIISASKVEVYYEDKKIYEYKILFENVLFCQIINHSNGQVYLIFNRELYGYSILELNTMKEFQYYPKENMKKGGETFILTQVFYNPSNNFIAAFGCYWACPFYYILFDFSNPFNVTPYLDTYFLLNKIDVEDPDGKCWEGNDFTVIDMKTKKKIVLSENMYMSQYNALLNES